MKIALESSPSFAAHLARRLPALLGMAAALMFVAFSVRSLIHGGPIDWQANALRALGVGLVASGCLAPLVAYDYRRTRRSAARAVVTWRIFLMALAWSLSCSFLGFFVIGCSGIGSESCWSTANLGTSLEVALAVSVFLSFMALSS